MRDLVRSGEAEFFEIYQSRLNDVWTALKGSSSAKVVRFVLAQGAPSLGFVQFILTEQATPTAMWQSPRDRHFTRDWLWLALRRFGRLRNVEIEVPSAWMDALYLRIRDTKENARDVTMALVPTPFDKLVGPWPMATSSDGMDVFLRVRPRDFLAGDWRDDIESAAQALVANRARFHAYMNTQAIGRMRDDLESGLVSLSPNDPTIIHVSALRPDTRPGAPHPTRRSWQDANNYRFNPCAASTHQHVQALMEAARDHLHKTPGERRSFTTTLFSHAWRQQDGIREYARDFMKSLPEPEAGIRHGKSVVVSMQIVPMFHALDTTEQSRVKCAGDKSWMRLLLREIAALGALTDDAAKWSKGLLVELSEHEVQRNITEMLKVGQICKDASGCLVPTTNQVMTEEEVSGKVVMQFYESVFSLLSDCAAQLPPKNFFWGWRVMSCDERLFDDLRNKCMATTKSLLEFESICPVRDSIWLAAVELMPSPDNAA